MSLGTSLPTNNISELAIAIGACAVGAFGAIRPHMVVGWMRKQNQGRPYRPRMLVSWVC